ncbi:unnamed protein product [Closterium sp. NIES-54]
MHSRLLVSGLPRSLPSLPRSPAPPCLPCVEGRQHAAPHSSEFPPTTAPLQTLCMDVWGPAPVGRTDQECYFLLVVDDYTRYTNFFPLWRKAVVSSVLIPWIRATRRQLRERLHSNRGEHRIGMIMEVARTSMIHSAAPHFLKPFVVRYVAHQLNLLPHVWGALSLVRDAKASKLSSCTLRYVFLGFPTDAPSWQFYHPHLLRVFSSQDVTFDESVCYYMLLPHPVPLPPLFFVPVPPPPSVDPLPPQGPAPSSVSQVDPPPLVEPLDISSDSSGPAEGGDPAANDTAATRRSPRLETPPGFPPRPSSSPPQPAAVDSGAEIAAVGEPLGGPGAGHPPQPDLLETLSPQAISAWIVRRGNLDGGGYGPTGARAASPGGTAGAGGTGGTTGGAASAGGTRGAAGARGAGATSPRGATGAGGARPTSPGGTAGAGGAGGARRAGGAAGAGGVGDGGTGGAGVTGTIGAGGYTSARGPSAAGASGAADAGGAGGAARAAGAGGAGAAGAGGAGDASTALR